MDEEDGMKVEMEEGDVIEEEEEEEGNDEGLTMNRLIADVGSSMLMMGARSR